MKKTPLIPPIIFALGLSAFVVQQEIADDAPLYTRILGILPFVYLIFRFLRLRDEELPTQEYANERLQRIEKLLWRVGIPLLKYGTLFIVLLCVILLLGIFFDYNVPSFAEMWNGDRSPADSF